MIRFKFPVSYGGKEVYEVMSPLNSSDETVVCMSKKNCNLTWLLFLLIDMINDFGKSYCLYLKVKNAYEK